MFEGSSGGMRSIGSIKCMGSMRIVIGLMVWVLFSCSGGTNQSQEIQPTEISEECIFDQATQTNDFLKEKPLFKEFKWDSISKVASGVIGADSIQITRGGCTHFSFYVVIRTKELDTLEFSDQKFGFKKALNLVRDVFPEPDFELFERLINEQLYELQEQENQKSYYFRNGDYCNTSLIIERLPNGFYQLEIGYYIC